MEYGWICKFESWIEKKNEAEPFIFLCLSSLFSSVELPPLLFASPHSPRPETSVGEVPWWPVICTAVFWRLILGGCSDKICHRTHVFPPASLSLLLALELRRYVGDASSMVAPTRCVVERFDLASSLSLLLPLSAYSGPLLDLLVVPTISSSPSNASTSSGSPWFRHCSASAPLRRPAVQEASVTTNPWPS